MKIEALELLFNRNLPFPYLPSIVDFSLPNIFLSATTLVQLLRPTPPKLLVYLYHFFILKLSPPK